MGKILKHWLPLAILVVAGVASLAVQRLVLPPDETPSDWRRAAQYVLERAEPSDAIRVHPNWIEAPLPYLTDVDDRLSRQDTPVPGDLQGDDRVWIISETDRVQEAVDRLPWRPENPQKKAFGPVSVILADVPEALKFEYELLDHLEGAEVAHVTPSAPKKKPEEPDAPDEADAKNEPTERGEQCKNWNAEKRRWYCGPENPWIFVGEIMRFVNDNPRRCIWAHPPGDDKVLRVTFPDVPLTDTFRVRAGLTFRASRSDRGGPVRMQVEIGHDQVVDHTYPATSSTWFPHDIDTSKLAAEAGESDVTFEISSEAIHERYFCLNGWAL